MGQAPERHLDFEDWHAILLETAKQFGDAHDSVALSIREACVRAYSGVSPALMRELCSAARIDNKAAVVSLSEEQWVGLHEHWSAWVQRILSGTFAATSSSSGSYSVLGGCEQPEDDLLTFLHGYYGQRMASDYFTHVSKDARQCTCAAEPVQLGGAPTRPPAVS
jgi:predicted ribosome quality control (RQC) complex YloA/Tae2 family protein